MRFFSRPILFVSRCISGRCVEPGWTLYCKCTNFQANHNEHSINHFCDEVGLYIANVLTFKRITTSLHISVCSLLVGLYIANVLTFKRITTSDIRDVEFEEVGLYIANVLTFKRITTVEYQLQRELKLDSILQMY